MNTKHKTIPIFVPHWGCPQNCSFCDQKTITGVKEKMTVSKAEALIRQGIAGKKQGDFLEIGFFGGSFTGIPAEEQDAFLGLAKGFVQTGEVDGIRLSTRPDYIDDTVIKRLLSYGVTTVELGAQSMDAEVLAKNRRGHTPQQTIEAAGIITQAGLDLGMQMMLGLPGDSPKRAIQTAKEIIALKPRCVRIYPTMVIAGTELAGWFLAGEYTPLDLEGAVSQCATLYEMFTAQQIEVIRMGLLNMEQASILAGPYHPAFGELVRGRVFYDKMRSLLSGFSKDSVCFSVHPQDVSALVGQKRENIEKLKDEFSIAQIKLIQDSSIERGDIIIN